MYKTPQYPEPNPVIIGKGQLAWAQEMHQTNERVAAERAGILDLKPKPKRWWHRNKADTEPKQPQQF